MNSLVSVDMHLLVLHIIPISLYSFTYFTRFLSAIGLHAFFK